MNLVTPLIQVTVRSSFRGGRSASPWRRADSASTSESIPATVKGTRPEKLANRCRYTVVISESFPSAKEACDGTLGLPLFPDLTNAGPFNVTDAIRVFAG